MSNKQFISNLSSAYADVRKLDVKKINLKGKNILEYIKDATPTIKHSQDTRETVTEDDLWGQYIETKADGTIIKALEDGIAEIEYYKYPVRINESTPDTYEFELSSDVLEVMPYGVAADVLKSDVSNAYGNVYAQRYEQMKSQLDIRYNTGSIEIEEGVIV